MSIRIKLILTYAILVIVSAIVLIFSGIAIITNVVGKTTEAVLEEEQFHVVVTDVIDLLAELKQSEEYDPARLASPSYIEELTEKTNFYNGGLVVNYEGKYYNYSDLPRTDSFHRFLIQSDQSAEQVDRNFEENHVIKYGDQSYFYIDYTFKVDDKDLIYFFVVDISNTKDVGSKTGKNFFNLILVILLIIMVPLLIILTNDIIKPVRKLEAGVKLIKEGNLNFKLETKKKNEIGRVITYFDIMREELKRSIDKQVQYEENRKELISSISHDLKTPITSIKGYVEGIRDGVANTPEKLDKYLKVIYQKSNDMDQLIDDLFLFSKLDLNRVPFEMKDVKIMPLINDVVNEMKIEWENDTQKINLKINSKDVENESLNIDIQAIKRVLVNVVQNSIKYMDKDYKEINITVNDNDKFLQIVISDNGIGIDEEHLKHIFDRFYRVDESRNSSTGGTGLGLAITKQIIDQHGGNIFASSTLGNGTKIVIELKKSDKITLEKGSNDV